MRKIILFLLLVSAPSFLANGQDKEADPSPVLEKLFNRLVNNFDDDIRIRTNDSIRIIIDNYVYSDSVFTHRFSNLRYLGQITSPDSSIKIVTWNLVLAHNPGRYFCYIIRRDSKEKANVIYRLSATYREEPVKNDTTYCSDDWYGALYYDIRPYSAGNDKCWIMLGIDFGNPFVTRKVIEVLNFSPRDSVVFGRKWFDTGENLRFRVVFEYSSGGMMTLRFTSDTSIVFDHLVPFSPEMKDDRQYYGPDYSYDAYNFENGKWKFMLNVDARNKE